MFSADSRLIQVRNSALRFWTLSLSCSVAWRVFFEAQSQSLHVAPEPADADLQLLFLKQPLLQFGECKVRLRGHRRL